MSAQVHHLRPPDNGPVTYKVQEVPIARIRAFAGQPRKWFDPQEISARAESMRAIGQQDPVTVEPVHGDPEHDYELINGESRLRSAREAGLKTLWCAVRSRPFGSETEKHLASLVANFNRSDHTPMEISDALHLQVTEGGRTQREVARALGKCESWVSQYLQLQHLPDEIKALMHPTLPKAERVACATGLELARLSPERLQEVLQHSRGPDGKLILKRVQIRAARRLVQQNADEQSPQAWTPEREQRYVELHRHDPACIARRRAGIEEFRRMLEARSTR